MNGGMAYARSAVAGMLAAVVVILAMTEAPAIEATVPVALLLLGVVALLVAPDLLERIRRHE